MRELRFMLAGLVATAVIIEMVLQFGTFEFDVGLLTGLIIVAFVATVVSTGYLWSLNRITPQNDGSFLLPALVSVSSLTMLGAALITIAAALPVVFDVKLGPKLFTQVLGSGLLLVMTGPIVMAGLFFLVRRTREEEYDGRDHQPQ